MSLAKVAMGVSRWLQMQCRLSSYICRTQPPQPRSHYFLEKLSWRQMSSSDAISSSLLDYLQRGIHTSAGPNSPDNLDAQKDEASDTELTGGVANSSVDDPQKDSIDSKVSYTSVTSSLKVSPRHDLALIFTCKRCETRSMKTVCRESYEKGVVVVRCGGCDNLHLIADRLGWFGQPGSIEDLLTARGEEVKRGAVDSLNFTLDDIAGKRV